MLVQSTCTDKAQKAFLANLSTISANVRKFGVRTFISHRKLQQYDKIHVHDHMKASFEGILIVCDVVPNFCSPDFWVDFLGSEPSNSTSLGSSFDAILDHTKHAAVVQTQKETIHPAV